MIADLPIAWLVEALIASTILMVTVLLLRGPVRKAFGAEIAYALWALPVLRLVLPPLPASWHEAAVTPISHATETVTVLFIDPVADVAAAAPGVAWAGPAVAALWIAGAAVFLIWHSLAHRRFCRRMLDAAAATERRGDIRVIESDAASGPLAFGIWRRYVAFPRDFAERYDAEERDLHWRMSLGTTRAAICSPTGWRCWCLPCTGSTRSRGVPSARSAPTRKSPTTRACWRG